MKESAQAAFSYTRSKAVEFGIEPDFHEKNDIHIHVPEGAIPKDGPSAGITMATALISALTGRAVSKEVAMTGEITLRGRVLPIGGLKEKSLAAHRAGIRKVLVPKDNARDLQEVPESIREELEFVMVSHMDEVLAHALVGGLPPVHVLESGAGGEEARIDIH
jgi:ATP-dependent Lon protease